MSSSSFLEIRLFYIRIIPCSTTHAPPSLTLTHLRRPINVSLQINGSKIASYDPVSLRLHRDRLDSASSEATYICTENIKLSAASDFEVYDDTSKTLILCGTLEKIERAWSNGTVYWSKEDRKKSSGWSMDVFVGAGINGSGLMKGICLHPTVEVYVAGCYGGVPLILTQTVQIIPRSKKVYGGLDSIPEDDESAERKENGLVSQNIMKPVGEGESDDGYESDMKHRPTYYPEGWYIDEDGQLSWFNAGVRVGVGIGLGMCVGIGIGVGLLMRSYQATTRGFRKRFF